MPYDSHRPQPPSYDIPNIPWDKLAMFRPYVPVILGVLILLYLALGAFYTVDADSEAVVLRFGRHARVTKPGLHLRLPWPIEEVVPVRVKRIQSMEFGFRTIKAGQVTQYAASTEEQRKVSRMLTGDLNLGIVEWIVQYKISNPKDYLYEVDNVAKLIRDVAEAVMRQVVGDSSIDEVITTGRDRIASEARDKMQDLLSQHKSGIEVIACKLQAATPPNEVKSAFDDVNRAKQNQQKIINDALGDRNRLIPAARGERDRKIAEAEGYHSQIIQEASGEISAFLARLEEYEKAPEVTRERLYLEAMQEIFAGAEKKIIIDSDLQGLLPLLQLETEQVKEQKQ